MNYWLMKSEPAAFSIDELQKREIEPWNGVRNYQARNFIREMKPGDKAIFYHSSCQVPGAVGIMEIDSLPYPEDDPKWTTIDVAFIEKFKSPLALSQMRKIKQLKNMILLKRGNRLSVMPITQNEFEIIVKKGRDK
ncbi:MAG: EVE domain-containing protein [Bacteriovoracia bacterium]